MKRKGNIYIGTSGWSYKHWKGTFYPEKTKATDQLNYYQQLFDTVEINNSFYRLPSAETIEHWIESVSKDFLFSVKASRYITHLKKLHDAGPAFDEFLARISKFKAKLGPILFQLPPNLKYNRERLQKFLEYLPKAQQYVFEFRNKDWYCEEVYDLLTRHNCAFCIFELAGDYTPEIVTADFVYVRLHGPGENKYQGSYTDNQLNDWAKKCKKWQRKSLDVFIYFDNDEKGYAGFNVKTLKEILK
jgi:uncharacterized protein YecE (DUF72 family)